MHPPGQSYPESDPDVWANAPVAWRPTERRTKETNAARLLALAGLTDWWELVHRAGEEPEWFWPLAIQDMDLDFSQPWELVADDSRGPAWTKWFVGGRLNIARNCVHRWARRRPAAVAVIGTREDGSRRELTFAELSRDVTRLAEQLIENDVRTGDRVALFLPMSPDAVIASHTIAHIGAVQVPLFSGFGLSAVVERLQASESVAIITTDETYRRGVRVPMLATVEKAVDRVPSLKHILLAPFALGAYPGRLEPLEVESEHPYLIAYTSGTTGRPKAVLHVQGGFLVSITREACYAADVTVRDRVHFVTDMGWLMGPWTLVGPGALGATIVCAEGAPDSPPHRLWNLVQSERISVLGVSPTLIRSLVPAGPPAADLSSLKSFVSTGEPWNPSPYRWLYRTVGQSQVPIINISGGTEVGACFLAPTPIVPIKECSVGGPAPGNSLDVLDPEGNSLMGTGRVGELVSRRPFPGMTRGFVGEPDRYLETYWSRFPGLWCHGDWASVDSDGAWFLHGRSDDTIKIAGKRIGPAELESAALSSQLVTEAAAVGVPDSIKGEVPWIICANLPGAAATAERMSSIAESVAAQLGNAFRPSRVLLVSALPKTRSGKIVRRAIRATVLNYDPGDLSGLENPEALAELRSVLQAL